MDGSCRQRRPQRLLSPGPILARESLRVVTSAPEVTKKAARARANSRTREKGRNWAPCRAVTFQRAGLSSGRVTGCR